MRMPLKAIEFAALGGTNFSQLELLRSTKGDQRNFNDFAYVGHTADEMVLHAKQKLAELEDQALCREFIISGGVRSCLQGFELVQKLGGNSVYGQAKAFLDHADGPYEKLQEFVRSQAQGLAMANAFLSLKVN